MKHIYNQLTKLAALSCLVVALLIGLAAPTSAAFPGTDGEIAYGTVDIDFDAETITQRIARVSSAGTLLPDIFTHQLPFSEIATYGVLALTPSYSADGQKIAFGAMTDINDDTGLATMTIYSANADGSSRQVVRTYQLNTSNGEGCVPYAFSLNPDGTKLVYSEYCSNEEFNVATIHTDGTGYQILFAGTINNDARHTCYSYPKYSPDGSKIAFNQMDEDGSSITIANADGSEPSTLVEVNTNMFCDGKQTTSHFMGAIVEGFASPLDWSPDGEAIVYVSSPPEGNSLHSDIKVATLGRVVTTIDEAVMVYDNDAGGYIGRMTVAPQFTPQGRVIFKEIGYSEDQKTVRIVTINRQGGDRKVVLAKQGSSEDFLLLYDFITPTVRPVSQPSNSSPNQTTLPNAKNGHPILLQTPDGTDLTCSSTTKESGLSLQDDTYDYPLGLVEFCFDTAEQNNEVSLTFVTDLKPTQVIARKHNPDTSTFFDIPNATITQTQYHNQPALQLTYTIEDNGELDLDPITGQIKDPVGLALRAGGLAETGSNAAVLLYTAATIVLIGASGLARYRHHSSSR